MVQPSNPILQLTILLLALLVAIWGVSLYEIDRNKREQIHNAEIGTAIQAQAFAENTLSSIKRINELLLDLRSKWSGDYGKFSTTIKERQEYITDLAFQVAVIDRAGYLAYSNLAPATDRTYLGDREHFKVHLNSKEDRLFISKPLKGKVSGKWTIQFTRPIYREGLFKGVIVASVSPDTFANFRKKLELSNNAIITMARNSGEIMARYPSADEFYGVVVKGIYNNPDAPISGNFSRLSQTDGIERVFGYYKLVDYKLTFFVAESSEYLLRSQKHFRITVFSYAAAISILLLGLMLALLSDLKTRKQAEIAVQQERIRLDTILRMASDGIHILDDQGVLIEANEAFLTSLGYDNSVIGKLHVADWDVQIPKEKLVDIVRELISSPNKFETRHRRKDGTEIDVEINAKGIELNGKSYLYAASRDITDRKRIEEQLRKLTVAQNAMLDNELVGIVKLRNRRAVWLNKAMYRIFGYEKGELEGQPSKILYPDDHAYQALGDHAYPILAAQGIYQTQLEMVRKDGEKIWIDLSGVLLSDDSGESMWTMTDITKIKKQEVQYKEDASHDPLTGLPNRLLVVDRLAQAIALADRSRQTLAVCYLDLDGFKQVNDDHGHATGDVLLIEIANRIEAFIRLNDTVGRIGGDEFVLLLTNLENEKEYQVVLDRITNAINEPVIFSHTCQVQVSASIGVAIYPSDSKDPETLIRYADQAMYKAKKLGRNQVCQFVNLS